MRWATRDQRPDLPGVPSRDVWPEYNLHGDVVGRMWHRLYDDVGHLQSIGWDDATGDVLLEANAVACVWDERYPLTPIDEYVTWRRDDGLLLDPWMRVHERLGARLGPTLPRSLRITGTVAEWEAWTGLPLPASGTYAFPHGLAPLEVDRDADRCTYWEPNVWFIHDV